MLKTLVLLSLLTYILATACPDGSSCPGTDTCCQLDSGAYGCCPYASAVCCTDHLHCCPSGTTCDVSKGSCTQSNSIVSKVAKIASSVKVQTTCGDGSTCPGTCTCCQLSAGGFGCCPYEKATCCPDQQHCCPEGYKCDLGKGECVESETRKTFSFRSMPQSK
eukprot:TRINITY_DN1029_c0_g1_i1.p1 TRINITY_DN1029_c0_g1~~TRINITY_DN1029_c0_g1_i1.p1  ORF type:complete len:184 (+),score=32.92 TRINITY_DN1029_c0_g1_i1:66-554(+)